MLFFIILILSFASGYFLPWWIVAVISFLTALFIGTTAKSSFWQAFIAVLMVWIVLALFKSIPNDHIMATRIAHLFHLPDWGYILALTGILGGLVGGMSALSGLLLKRAFQKH
ncbi:hypothetical protein J3L18_30150 [Mucilaginibacter gossypii]|uniref:hypothetical protein n=1 Tax=Mucilaginibacter gossypii TaxID=551996 RepID=UPI0011BED2ED|nr:MULTISPECIES: hypothetical protein [Mucilaginibacter]QTE37317.1 hypothetical protein J3L18_30150 [Mucilaginibacter gossypii]